MGEDQSSNKINEIWSLIGKLGTIIGLVLGLVQLCSFVIIPEYNLEAKGTYYEQELPFPITKEIERLDKIVNPGYKHKIRLRNTVAFSNSTTAAISNSINDSFSAVITNASIIEQYKNRWHYTIKNTGKKEVVDMKMELPYKGYYYIEKTEGAYKLSYFNKVVSLGSLRPLNEIAVNMWTSDDYSYGSSTQDIRITHPSGVFKVSYSKCVTGFIAWLDEQTHFAIVTILGAFLVIVVFFLGALLGPRVLQALR